MNFILIFTILYGLLPLVLNYAVRAEKIDSIFPFLVVVFVASLYEYFGSIVLRIDYENWYLIYNAMAFFGIMYFFKKSIEFNKKYVYLFYILFVVMMCLTFSIWKTVHYFQIGGYFHVFQTALVLLFSIQWFKRCFLTMESDSLWQNPTYYFVAGLNIYYFGTVILFLMASYISKTDRNNLQYYWLLNIVLNLVLRTLLMVGVWKARVRFK
jgi:hypothetical protein